MTSGRRRESRRESIRRQAAEIAAMPLGPERTAAEEAFRAKGDAAKRAIESAKAERMMIRDRLRYGYVLSREMRLGECVVEPFVEEGLRSRHWGIAAKLFLRGLPKRGRLRTSRDKAIMSRQHVAKILSCDEPWIEGNRSMVSMIRVDLDAVFESMDDLRRQLSDLVASGDLPCMPHLVAGGEDAIAVDVADLLSMVARGEPEKRLVKPHLWFLLPDAVGTGRKHKKRPQTLVDSVYRGLVNVLLPLGADPKAKWRLVRGKNPLSPLWIGACFNKDSFPSLAEYAAVLGTRMRITYAELARDAAAQAVGNRTFSNAYFDAASKTAWSILRGWHERAYGPYRKAIEEGPDALRTLLRQHLTVAAVADVEADVHVPERAEYVLDLTAGYAAASWSPERADEVAARARRGRLSHLTAGVTSLKERQAIAGRVTAEARANAAQTRIIKAMNEAVEFDAPFTVTEIARRSGLHRNTVSKHWRFCVSRCTRRCVDKKVSRYMATSSQSRPVPRTVPRTVRVFSSKLAGGTSVIVRGGQTPSVEPQAVVERSEKAVMDVPVPSQVETAALPEAVESVSRDVLTAEVRSETPTESGSRTVEPSVETPQDRQNQAYSALKPNRVGPRPPAILFMRAGVPQDAQSRADLEARIREKIIRRERELGRTEEE